MSLGEMIETGDVTSLQKAFSKDDSLSECLIPGTYMVNGRRFSQVPAIHYSILVTKIEILHLFISRSTSVNVLLAGHWTPLHLAAFLGLTDFVEMILMSKPIIDSPDKWGVFSHFP
jgi:ankyrin repeat protein